MSEQGIVGAVADNVVGIVGATVSIGQYIVNDYVITIAPVEGDYGYTMTITRGSDVQIITLYGLSTEQYNAMLGYLEQAQAASAAAETAQEGAENARDAAQAALNQAITYASNASTSASAAAQSAQDASNYDYQAAQARYAAVAAKEAAVAAQSAAESAQTAAETAASNAGTSATNADTSATNAASSAASAAGSASNASQNATNAATSAAAAAQTLTQVQAEGATQIAAIDAEGQRVLDSIPVDYSQMEADVTDLKSKIAEIDPQFDYFNLYDRVNNIVGKYIDNNGAIQDSGTGATIAKVAVENGVTYTICRPTYQQYSSGRMLVVASDGTTVLATVNLDTCTSVQYGEYVAKKYTVASTGAAYILFNVKLGAGDAINNTIVTARDINGSQETVITEIYDCNLPTPTDIEILTNSVAAVNEIATEDYYISIFINGDNYQVRSAWDDSNDIAVLGQFHGSSNGAFRFDRLATIVKTQAKDTYNGTLLAYIDDDICPIKLQNSYIGGNHGYAAAFTLTFTANHGITESDIGKIITDANSNVYVILSVPTAKTLFVCSTYTGNVDAPITNTKPVSPATLDGATLTFTSSNAQQLRPAINNVVQTVMVDGVRKVVGGGVYDGRYVDIAERYDIIDIGAMLAYLQANVGSNTNSSYYNDAISGYCTVSNIYRFTERGAVTVYSDVLWHVANTIEYIGMIQSSAMGGQYISVPQSSVFELYDMGTTTLNVPKNDGDIQPKVFYDFSNSAMSNGMVIGYHPIGSAADAHRKDLITAAVQYFGSTHKIYPKLYGTFVASVGQIITAVAFRTPTLSTNGKPAVSWYYVGDTPYVLINAQSSINGYIALPSYFEGMIPTMIESDGTIEIKSAFVNSNGLYVSVTDAGFAWVRLDK